IGSRHCFPKPAKIFDVPGDHMQPFFIRLGGLQMPRSTGAEVVVDYDLGIGPMEQASDQMAADEARSACHEETTQRISSENVVRIKYNIRLVASGQWLVARKGDSFTGPWPLATGHLPLVSAFPWC